MNNSPNLPSIKALVQYELIEFSNYSTLILHYLSMGRNAMNKGIFNCLISRKCYTTILLLGELMNETSKEEKNSKYHVNRCFSF